MKHYIGTFEEVQAIEAMIRANANIPNNLGTTAWSDIRETINSGVYAVLVPERGWGGYSYAEMTAGITHEESSGVDFPTIDEI